eukprot:TRINITY_DN65962_c0_g2_i1.p1 TRINITY_DN65962_c0_g2~~TRINITY_DN65962_c0_g2_i1.p1  ORF type:complete len:343 (+),score=63.84 TRINITY_DN65962_c0_g2_i1:75-1103(+)
MSVCLKKPHDKGAASWLCGKFKKGIGCGGKVERDTEGAYFVELTCPNDRLHDYLKEHPWLEKYIKSHSGAPRKEPKVKKSECLLQSTHVKLGDSSSRLQTLPAGRLAADASLLQADCEGPEARVEAVKTWARRNRDLVTISFQTPDGEEGSLRVTAEHWLLGRARGSSGKPVPVDALSLCPGFLIYHSDGRIAARVVQVKQEVVETRAVEIRLEDVQQTFLALDDLGGPALPVLGDVRDAAAWVSSGMRPGEFIHLKEDAREVQNMRSLSQPALAKVARPRTLDYWVVPDHDKKHPCKLKPCWYFFNGLCSKGAACDKCHNEEHFRGRNREPSRRGGRKKMV